MPDSIDFLTPLRLVRLDADPTGLTLADKGATWYSNTLNKGMYWNGTAAIPFPADATGAPTVVLLDKVGAKDTMAWVDARTDAAGVQDKGPSWGLFETDAAGIKDSALITGQGTPQWLAVATAGLTAAASSITVSKPAGVAVGDLLLLLVATSNVVATGAAVPATPAGWNVGPAVSFAGTVEAIAASVFTRIADGTEGATLTENFSASAAQATAEYHRLSGTDTTTPINVSATDTLAATALVTNPVNKTVTTTVVNTLVFAWLVHFHAALTNSHSPPASNNERTDFEAAAPPTPPVILASTTDTRVFAAAAATGTATHACTEAVATDAVTVRFAIAPGNISVSL